MRNPSGSPSHGAPALLHERATGIEPAFSAWEADVLPLNYARGAPRPYQRCWSAAVRRSEPTIRGSGMTLA
ncbi:MAG: hypothetical protein QOJ52_378 [Acidimicrobiaceae bacterium]|nr:hypothetical protein [Acidimicrobiaceae bacterium]